ncbi:hypothetical protein LRS03_00440 [Rhizobacter sp. J219]|uniref:hypothetical protein n=1 Tax=Rhizobacter sp. J219 TaxID=2898430 RepID=UPI0021513A67|nr:hypothetical protein [Rhizobacter sp. J219]MCR5881411.1 hypothetical protein [Rhizobacter sp. J219]
MKRYTNGFALLKLLQGLGVFLFALAALPQTASAQNTYTDPQDIARCQTPNVECVRPTRQDPYQYNFVDYPSGGGNISVPAATEAESKARYLEALGGCSVSFTDLPWMDVPQPPASGTHRVGASCGGQPGDGGWVNFSGGLESFQIVCQTRAVVVYPRFNYGGPTCDKTRTVEGYKARWSTVSCPAGFNFTGGYFCYRYCPAGNYSTNGAACSPIRYIDVYRDKPKDPSCPTKNPQVGNPIYPLTGAKRQDVGLGIRIGGQEVTISYDTRTRLPGAVWNIGASPSFGPLWQSNLHKSMVLQSESGGPGSAYSSVALMRGGGRSQSGSVDGMAGCTGGGGGPGSASGGMLYTSPADKALRIDFTGGTGRLVDGTDLLLETYSPAGVLLTLGRADGSGGLTYVYSDANTPPAIAPAPGLLIQVNDHFGRSISFAYEQPTNGAPRVVAISDTAGQVIRAAYDTAGNLSTLTWPDNRVETFVYERSDLPWALTGIVDGNGRRHATYGYDNAGRATSTELAGGVNKFTVSYWGSAPGWSVSSTQISPGLVCREHSWTAPGGAIVVQPNGSDNRLTATTSQGMTGLAGQTLPAGSGCAASTSAQRYDAQGNVSSYDDHSGRRTCFAYDSDRRLRTITLEGLLNTTNCPANLETYVPPANSANPVRITRRSWHPDWVLETRRSEPGRITTSVYNGQPDPFAGGAIASCAPASALLPDGKPIVVLCKRVEQATTDATGAAGFSAAIQAGVAARVTTWTYNGWGQVLSEDGPRTDVSDVTTYAYYADTVFTGTGVAAEGHSTGDLHTVTNARGGVVRYTKYNRHGQVLESIDPNGVPTTYSYDQRLRLRATTTNNQSTLYDYDAVGQLKRVTLPDQSWIGYDYDDAHRQVAVYNHQGSRIDYVLDNAGNRIGESVRDPEGNLKRQLSRSIDARGQIQQITGRE